MRNKIIEELHQITEMKNYITKKLKNAPDGSVRCAICKGTYQYYIGREYQRLDNRNLVKKICEKEYLLDIEKKLDNRKRVMELALKEYDKNDLQETYRNLHQARKQLVSPIVRPIEDIIAEFEIVEYEGKGFDENDKTEFYTIKGERVRSKSEKIIADELYRNGIPYKYEMPLELNHRNKKVTVYPDFTALNKRTGKKYILEHLGMMDNAAYVESAMFKLDLYEKNHYLLGQNLIFTHETSSSPLNTIVLNEYINTYLC